MINASFKNYIGVSQMNCYYYGGYITLINLKYAAPNV